MLSKEVVVSRVEREKTWIVQYCGTKGYPTLEAAATALNSQPFDGQVSDA